MKSYDVVFYAYWVHSSHIHKYIALHNRLKKHCNVLTLMAKDEFGITDEEFNLFRESDVEGVVHVTMEEALEKLQEVNFKVGLFSSNGRKGWVAEDGDPEPLHGKDIEIAKSKGAVTIQISEMMSDFYYAGADIASLVSKLEIEWHRSGGHRYQWRPFDADPQPKYMFSNCLLWDNTDECLPYHLTREQFCEKYNLNPEKDFYVWLPDAIINLFRGTPRSNHYRNIYKEVCSLDNVVIKLHPHDYKGLNYFKFGNEHSSELFANGTQASVVEPIDTHWCYKYASCGISSQSSVSIEFPMYRTPFLYVDIDTAPMPWKRYFASFAHHCRLDELREFMTNKDYEVEIGGMHDYYDNEVLASNEKALDILTRQVINILENGI